MFLRKPYWFIFVGEIGSLLDQGLRDFCMPNIGLLCLMLMVNSLDGCLCRESESSTRADARKSVAGVLWGRLSVLRLQLLIYVGCGH